MPLSNYAVLKGRPIRDRLGTSGSPHYQVEISANGDDFRIAVNVRSQDGSEVQYLVRSHFEHPITNGLPALAEGVHPLERRPGGLAVDFIRGNIAQPWEFAPLPMSAAGPDNDLNEKIDGYVQRAMADERAMVYAFGDTWGPETKADRYFGFKPGQGIHDIHFNQGNPPGPFAGSNGSYQDGALIFEFPDEGKPTQWVGVFLKFQTQAWHSDDAGGGPILPPDPDHPGHPHTPPDGNSIPPLDVPDGLVRIIAAKVNDKASPEHETVTLLNTSDLEISIDGWALLDSQKRREPLTGSIAAGATRLIAITPTSPGTPAGLQLSNKGGLITLVNADGIKVHGVSYTGDQARQPGRTIPF
jgi:uncharacterized protein YukJ